jgi:hypothetical protein
MINAHTLSGEARSNMHHYCGRTVTTDALFTVGYVPDLTPFVGGDFCANRGHRSNGALVRAT